VSAIWRFYGYIFNVGNREKITFQDHAGFLSTLLIHLKKWDNVMTLTKYVIAASASKILAQLQNYCHSKPFSNSLMEVSTFNFSEIPQISLCVGDPEMDHILICDILLPLSPHLKCAYPQLLQSYGSPDTEIYNKGTCVEFHWLLCKLIQQFKKSLANLLANWGPKSPATKPAGCPSFDDHLRAVMFFRSALYWLARGSAIENHLGVIEYLLNSRSHCNTVERLNENVEGDGSEHDDELAAV
jgi:hypothetical protein